MTTWTSPRTWGGDPVGYSGALSARDVDPLSSIDSEVDGHGCEHAHRESTTRCCIRLTHHEEKEAGKRSTRSAARASARRRLRTGDGLDRSWSRSDGEDDAGSQMQQRTTHKAGR